MALEAASRRGIIHRDIKPQNLLLSPDGTVKVTDFGIARSTEMTTMTRTGALMGTPHYMSPEQAQGQRVDIWSDIYSRESCCTRCSLGSCPVRPTLPSRRSGSTWTRGPERVRRLRSDIPGAVERIVNRCLEKDPSRRYTTPREMARALADAVPGVARPESRPRMAPALPQPPPIHPVEQGQRERRPRRRRCSSLGSLTRTWRGPRRTRWPWVVATLAIVAAVVAIGISAGGNELVVDMLNRSSSQAAAEEPRRAPVVPLAAGVGGTDQPASNPPPTPLPNEPTVTALPSPTLTPTATIVATPDPAPSPTLNPTPTMEPTPINPTNTLPPTDTPVGPTPTAPRPTHTP